MQATTIPQDYAERAYAGVLGKVIGVYLGRPFEGWNYDRIQQRLGDIEYYVHDKLNVPLIVTDDDISGTFTFLRSLADNHADPNLGSRQIGESWLNYLIEKRTILWWGGLGNSTEHTAYLRLKHGIPAPESGSAKRNGKVVAEQIGAQIFIDGWAMVSPGNADQAARLAEAAARVSHDGEAVYGAVALAVMEALAFVESDIHKLIDTALGYIPRDSVIARMIEDLRSWRAVEPDWRATREKLAGSYGYDKYGGNCHMVPNHGLIIHSLLHGDDDFSDTLKIVNTCGWDTDCNSGNVGCLMGIKNGLAGLDAGLERGFDWRGPVADRLYLPTAEGGRAITDCVTEADEIIDLGARLAGRSFARPKKGAQFHFSYPGSVQGFTITAGEGDVSNAEGEEGRCLRIAAQDSVRCGSPVFIPSQGVARAFEGKGYGLLATPRLYPGQRVTARVHCEDPNITIAPYVAYYGPGDEPTVVEGTSGASGEGFVELTQTVPEVAGPVFEVGIAIEGGKPEHPVDLDYLRWDGEPEVTFTSPDYRRSMPRRSWVDAVDLFIMWDEPYRVIQNEGTGLLIQGTRAWRNYVLTADVTPHLARRAGIAVRVQGLTRYYALVVTEDQKARIVRRVNEEEILAECDFTWQLGQTLDMSFEADGNRLTARIGAVELTATDTRPDLDCGGIALVIDEGRSATQQISVHGISR